MKKKLCIFMHKYSMKIEEEKKMNLKKITAIMIGAVMAVSMATGNGR